MDKLLAIFFSLLILLQAYIVKRQVHTWLFPACLFGLFWFFMSFLPLVVLWWVPIDPWGTGFILLCLFFFSGSAAFFPWKSTFQNVRNQKVSLYGSSFLRRTFYLSSAITIISSVRSSLAQGITVNGLIFDAITNADSYRDMVYSGHLTVTIWLRLAQIFVFATAILGGLIFSDVPTKLKRFRVIVAAFLPSVFMAVIQSGKGALFLSIALFYAGILVHRISRETSN